MQRFAVIGLGRFGQRLARALTAAEAEVIAIDLDASVVEAIRDEVTLAVRLDSTDEEALRAQGVQDVDVAVVGIGEGFEAAALTVATLKELKVKRIIARAQSDVQAKILTCVGADEIVLPETESALRWAHRLALPNLRQYVELGEGHSMVHMVSPTLFHHKSLKELDLRNAYGVNLVAIKRSVAVQKDPSAPMTERPIIAVPNADTRILPSDILILVGSDEGMGRLPED